MCSKINCVLTYDLNWDTRCVLLMNVFCTSLGETLPLQYRAVHIRVPVCLAHQSTLQHTATHCNTLQQPAIHCNTLQHIATHCTTCESVWGRHHLFNVGLHIHASQCVWLTATHCNALHHTATNTLSTTPLYIYMLQRVMQHAVTQVSLFCPA